MLRAFYKSFEGIFVLDEQHQNWLADPAIGFPANKIFQTAHWVEDTFKPTPYARESVFPGVEPDEKILLFLADLNDGVASKELPILAMVRAGGYKVRPAFVEEGPGEVRMRKEFPDSIFLGRAKTEQMPLVYSAADFLLRPTHTDSYALMQAMCRQSCSAAGHTTSFMGPTVCWPSIPKAWHGKSWIISRTPTNRPG